MALDSVKFRYAAKAITDALAALEAQNKELCILLKSSHYVARKAAHGITDATTIEDAKKLVDAIDAIYTTLT